MARQAKTDRKPDPVAGDRHQDRAVRAGDRGRRAQLGGQRVRRAPPTTIEDAAELLVPRRSPAAERREVPVLSISTRGHRNADLSLRSRQSPPACADDRDLRQVGHRARRPAPAAAIRRFSRATAFKMATGSGKTKVMSLGYRLAVLQRRAGERRPVRQDQPGHRAQRDRV